MSEIQTLGALEPQEIKGGCKKNAGERIFLWVGENERLSTSAPIRGRGVGKVANSSRGGRRPVWATPRVLNGLGGLDYCLNRSLFHSRFITLRWMELCEAMQAALGQPEG